MACSTARRVGTVRRRAVRCVSKEGAHTPGMFAAIKDAASNALPDTVKHAAKKKVNAWRGISEDEALVREATSSAKWGPHGEELRAMARLTLDGPSGAWRETVWRVLEERMRACDGERWRQCYKALTCCEFLVAQGHERCANDIKQSGHLERLMRFEHKDERGRDEGINVREKAKKLLALVSDPEAVREARDKAERNRGKYSGMSSEQARNRSTSMSSSSFDDGNRGSVSASASVGGRSAYEAPPPAATTAPPTSSQWDQVRVPPVKNQMEQTVNASATSFAPSPMPAARAPTTESTANDSSDDEDARPNAAPKIIFRDVAAPQQTAAAFTGAIPAFAPPPRAKNASTAAINYASGAPVAAVMPGFNAAAPATSSIDDLLGGLAAPAPVVTAPAPAASAASPWAGLDLLAGGMPSAPAPAPPVMQPQAAIDPFAAAFTNASPAPQPQPQLQPFMGDFAFAPPPQQSTAAHTQTAPYAAQPMAHAPPSSSSSDPFGLASFGKPSPPPRASASPNKSTDPIDALAALTADLGVGKPQPQSSASSASSSAASMSPFAGGSLI